MIWGISFTNTGIPMLIVGTLAVVLPFVLSPRDTRSHWRVAGGVAGTAGIVVLAGALVLVVFDPRQIGADQARRWIVLAQIYLRASLPLAMFWAPLLALVWFGQAQRVERLRNDDMVREAR